MPTTIAIQNKRLNDAEKLSGKLILKSLPQRLCIESSNACNLRCEMCGQSLRDFKRLNLSYEDFIKTKPFWKTAYDVSLFGWGEPLVNPNLKIFFNEVIEFKPRIFILTNGLLLNKELAQNFVDKELAFLNFSFDAAKKSTYNRIRKGSDYDTVIKNIKTSVNLRKKSGKKFPYLRMVFVGMKDNIDEFVDFVRLAKRLGMDEAKMVHMIAYSSKTQDQILFYQQEKTNEILKKAKEVAQKIGIKLTIPDLFDLTGKIPAIPHKPCYRAWEEMFISSDGKARLCMLSPDIMGDLKKEKITDIWNNQKYQLARKTINSRSPLSLCANCPQYREMNVNRIESFLQCKTVLPGEK